MKILLDGYIDRNLGDDLMLKLVCDGLREYELSYDKKKGYDVYLKVTGSGFLIHDNRGILYRISDMRHEKGYAPRRAVIGCNISPFINRAAERVIRKQLRDYDFITVRDSFSYEYIKRHVPSLKCEKYPDIAFSLSEDAIPDTPCENLLGIAVHNSMDSKKIARIADGYINETGNKVLLLCFDTGEENDALAAEKILAASQQGAKIDTVLYESIPDMLSQMKRCGCILGARLHSIILAARMGIPFVPMSYSDKTVHTLKEIGYGGAVYQARNFHTAPVLKNVLSPIPFELDKTVITQARKHITSLKEYLKQQS